jgi:Fur family ferric uptake transcriptional regulator
MITIINKPHDTMARENLRMTRQRQVILRELRKVNSHPSADQVYESVRRRLPRISLGTVYRNLEILSERGFIQKLDLGGTQRRFDGDLTTHYHIRCIKCGCVEDVALKPRTNLEDAVRGVSDYRIIGHSLEFIGLCPRCNKKKSTRTEVR